MRKQKTTLNYRASDRRGNSVNIYISPSIEKGLASRDFIKRDAAERWVCIKFKNAVKAINGGNDIGFIEFADLAIRPLDYPIPPNQPTAPQHKSRLSCPCNEGPGTYCVSCDLGEHYRCNRGCTVG